LKLTTSTLKVDRSPHPLSNVNDRDHFFPDRRRPASMRTACPASGKARDAVPPEWPPDGGLDWKISFSVAIAMAVIAGCRAKGIG